jgi:hypothetical protein
MKILKQVFWATGIFVLFFSCKKEKSLEGGTASGATQWEFKDSALLFNGRMDTAYIQTAGSISSIVLEGTSTDKTSDFYLEIFGTNITAGTYKSPYVQFTYVVNSAVLYESIPSNTDKFSVTITKIDADGITGTFSGEVEDVVGNTKKITAGAFTGKFKTSAPPSGTGQLTLWSKQGCGGSGSIAVKVQGQTGTITSFHTTAPACGVAGAANFTLPAGNYSWEAYCNTDTARGTVVVTPGSCSAVEVIFGLVSTNCVISNLAYYDLATNAKQGSLSSFFTASNQVNNILFVDSSTNSVIYRFTPARSGNRINIDAQQYFNVDASGRITDFHGLIDATDTSLPRIIVTYTFNASGYLSKAAYAFELAPTTNILNINYTWTGGNLSKAVVQQVGSTDKVEYDYQYDLNKTAKNFLAFFPSTEIFWVQSAINFGKNSTNVLTSSTIKYYDATGVATDNATYSNYIIDANNYVKAFSVSGDGSVLPGDTKYLVSYKCF